MLDVVEFVLIALAGIPIVLVLVAFFLCVIAFDREGSLSQGRWRAPLVTFGVAIAMEALAMTGIFVVGRVTSHPERFLPDVERASAPLIVAIDAYVRDRGTPPSSLDELVPRYLATIPSTDCLLEEQFDYDGGSGVWSLHVRCDDSDDGDEMVFTSTRRAWHVVSGR